MEGSRLFHPEALLGRVAIVTGAGARGDGIGIGRAIAITLGQVGAKVVVVDRTLALAERTAEMMRDAGAECLVVAADVSDQPQCEMIVQRTLETFGKLDILVNNVGVRGAVGLAPDVDPHQWEADLRVNVTSVMLMAKYSIPQMRKAGGGAIVNMSSVAGIRGGHPYLLYPTTKGAIVNMTRAMAVHHGPDGIRVNCVCPGLVYTPLVADTGMSEERRKARADAASLKTEGTAWDIADATLFLVSDASRWITGHVLPVDAGLTATANLVPSVNA